MDCNSSMLLFYFYRKIIPNGIVRRSLNYVCFENIFENKLHHYIISRLLDSK